MNDAVFRVAFADREENIRTIYEIGLSGLLKIPGRTVHVVMFSHGDGLLAALKGQPKTANTPAGVGIDYVVTDVEIGHTLIPERVKNRTGALAQILGGYREKLPDINEEKAELLRLIEEGRKASPATAFLLRATHIPTYQSVAEYLGVPLIGYTASIAQVCEKITRPR